MVLIKNLRPLAPLPRACRRAEVVGREKREVPASVCQNAALELSKPYFPPHTSMKKNLRSLLLPPFLVVSLGWVAILTWDAHSPASPPQKGASLEVPATAQPVASAGARAAYTGAAASVTESQPLPAPRLAEPAMVLNPTLSQDVPTGASLAASSAHPLVRDVPPPKAGAPILVPGHFDGIMVSHVPLAAPPTPVPPGTPRTPPKVINNPPEKGGGTTYVLDDTWAIPFFAPPLHAVTASQKASEPSPSSSK